MLGRTDNSNKKSARKGIGNQKNVSAEPIDVPLEQVQQQQQTSSFDGAGSARYLLFAWEKALSNTKAKKLVAEKSQQPVFNFLEAVQASHKKYITSLSSSSSSPVSPSSSSQQEQIEPLSSSSSSSSQNDQVEPAPLSSSSSGGGEGEEKGEGEGQGGVDANDDSGEAVDDSVDSVDDSQSGKKKKKKKKKKSKSKANEGTLTMEGGVLSFSPAASQENSSEVSAAQDLYEKIPKECARYLVTRSEKQQANTNAKSSASSRSITVPIRWTNGEGMMKLIKDLPTEMQPKQSVFGIMTSNTRGLRNVCARCYVQNSNPVKLCSQCNKIAYCSRECQQQHWAFHKIECKPDSLAESRRASAKERFQSTSSIRNLLFPTWQSKFGKGVVLLMCRDIYPYNDDEAARNVYMIYVTFADIKNEAGPFATTLRPHHSDLLKLSSSSETGFVNVVTVAVDQASGYIAQFTEKIRTSHLEVCKTTAGKEDDVVKADMVSFSQAPLVPVLYSFQ